MEDKYLSLLDILLLGTYLKIVTGALHPMYGIARLQLGAVNIGKSPSLFGIKLSEEIKQLISMKHSKNVYVYSVNNELSMQQSRRMM